MTRSHSSRGLKAQESAKAPASTSLDGSLPSLERPAAKETVVSYQEAVASLERFTATLPPLSIIVTTVEPRRREALRHVFAEGVRLAEVERHERRAIQRVPLSQVNRAEISKTIKKGDELGKRIIYLSERADQLFDSGVSIPVRPGIPSTRDERELCEAMGRHRERFWTALHMVPFVREQTLQELDRVRNGTLKAASIVFTKRSEGKSEAQLKRHVVTNARTARGMLERADWKPGLLNSARIATLLVEVPLFPEKQLVLMREVYSRTKELRELHDRLTERHGSVSNFAAQSDPEHELYTSRMRELGGGIEHVEAQSRVLEALREPYQRIKDYLVSSNLGLVGNLVLSHNRMPNYQEELMQDGVMGLMRAIEKYDPKTGFKLVTMATWWVAQAISRNRPNYYHPISIPVYQRKALGMINKAEVVHGSLSSVELAGRLGLKEDIVKAIRLRQRGVASISPIDGADYSEGEQLVDYRGQSMLDIMGRRECAERVRAMLARMLPRTAEVLRLRFGLDGDAMTLEQIAQRFGVTRERIRQIEARALGKIREGYLGKMLENFVE